MVRITGRRRLCRGIICTIGFAPRLGDIHKQYPVHVAGYNLGILLRALFRAGTPAAGATARLAFLFVITAAEMSIFVIVAASDAEMERRLPPSQPKTADQIEIFSMGSHPTGEAAASYFCHSFQLYSSRPRSAVF